MPAVGRRGPMADPWIFLLTGGALVLLGFVAAQVFDKVRFPDYFILMSVGLILGSGLVPLPVDPRESLKPIAPVLSAIAIAFILFEGGLVLHVRGLGKVWGAAGAHTVVAMALSIAGIVAAGTYLLGLRLTTSLIMALAFCGPSASIDMSMLSQLRVQERTRFTIVVEGVMGNVVAAVFVLLFINVSGLATDEPSILLYVAYLGSSILLYLGIRVTLTGISMAALLGAAAFVAVFIVSRWPSSTALSRAWRLPPLDRRILRATVSRGMTDTILILFAIEVGYIPAVEADLVTNLLFLVIIAAALTSALLVLHAERIARRAPAAPPAPGPAAMAIAGAPAPRESPLPQDLEHSLAEFLEDPIVQRGEID